MRPAFVVMGSCGDMPLSPEMRDWPVRVFSVRSAAESFVGKCEALLAKLADAWREGSYHDASPEWTALVAALGELDASVDHALALRVVQDEFWRRKLARVPESARSWTIREVPGE